MSRKAQLIERAARFSARMERKDSANGHNSPKILIWDNAHDGYVAGYKAAMRDVRKIIASNKGYICDHPQRRLESFYLRICQFVRPLQ